MCGVGDEVDDVLLVPSHRSVCRRKLKIGTFSPSPV